MAAFLSFAAVAAVLVFPPWYVLRELSDNSPGAQNWDRR